MKKIFTMELNPYDELFTTQEQRDDLKLERVFMVNTDDIEDFPDHPFKILKDEEFMTVVQSIKENGVITPAVGREMPDGKVQLISGHRRKLACEVLGIDQMPVIVRDMTDDEATISLVDSNIQRENILPSEKAKAYKMKMDAMSRKLGRPKEGQTVPNYLGKRSTAILGEETNESYKTVQRYIRLTKLIPPLLDMVDNKKIAFLPAVELSYLAVNEQETLLNSMELNDCTPSHAQAIRLKKLSQEYALTKAETDNILSEEKANQAEQIKIKTKDIQKYFPKSYTNEQIKQDIIKGLELLRKQRNRRMER